MRATIPLIGQGIGQGSENGSENGSADTTEHHTSSDHTTTDGERLGGGIPERVVVAPCLGVFEPHTPQTVTAEGEIIYAGQAIGVLTASGHEVEVRSPFAGFLMGLLAHPGERVREGQPVAWLRVFD